MDTKSETTAWETTPRVKGGRSIPPDAQGTQSAFSRIGYSLEEAISDLLDNSIDAGAKDALIRFFYDGTNIIRIAVVDNGFGMSEETLWHAMQFGARVRHSRSDLGKFGMGMKSASFSQCSSLTVISCKHDVVRGVRWTEESIKNNWQCESLDPYDCQVLFLSNWSPVKISHSGTIILWDRLTSVRGGGRSFSDTARTHIKRLTRHLGLHFHRFIENKKIRVHIDCRSVQDDTVGIPFTVEPLNPFEYSKTGHPEYPKAFDLDLNDVGKLKIEAHIWPRKSREPGYRLGGGKVSARQGFYFYRNDRLIQAGGWNGHREDDTEPHSSLARVCIDLPASLDDAFSIGVQKSNIHAPHDFLMALENTSSDGKTFSDFIKDAESVYRGETEKIEADFPFVISTGLPRDVRTASKKVFLKRGDKGRKVSFKWCKLSHDRIFELDRSDYHSGNLTVWLNSIYRRAVLGGSPPGASDASLVKVLIYLLLHADFDRERVSGKRQKWLDQCNTLLISAIESE